MTRSGCLAGIKYSVCLSKSLKMFCVSFCRMNSGLYICNIMAEGFRFMPLGLVRRGTFRKRTRGGFWRFWKSLLVELSLASGEDGWLSLARRGFGQVSHEMGGGDEKARIEPLNSKVIKIWSRWASRQLLRLPIVQTLLPVTFGYSLRSQAVVLRQLRRWKRLWRRSLTRSQKRTFMGPSRSC